MIFRFGDFELDLARVELRHGGQPCPVEPQVFALLALLVENRERLVSRDELIEKVWDGRIVTDAAIASRVKSARQALGDDGEAQRFIRTLHRKGFRFVADVKAFRDDTAPNSGAAPMRLARPSIAVLPFQMLGGRCVTLPNRNFDPLEIWRAVARMARFIGWIALSVGCRSAQISSGTPLRSSARISCAMNVSESRGYPLTTTATLAMGSAEGPSFIPPRPRRGHLRYGAPLPATAW